MLHRFLFGAVALLLLSGTASAAVYDDSTGRFRMWVPDDQDVVYGFYISYNSSGDDNRTLAARASWQQYAQTFGFGIIGTNITDTGDPGALLTAMTEFAQLSGRAEVEHAPVIVEGVSLGGYLAMEFGAAYPARTIAILSGASRQLVGVSGNDAFNKVPSLFHVGETDGDSAKRKADLLEIRAGGAQLGFWIQWGFDHGRWHGNKIGWTFLQDCVRLRYPINQNPVNGPVQLIDIPDDYGWLADPNTWDSGFAKIYAWADYPGDRSRAFWLPTADVAYIYRAHATSEAALQFVLPNSTVDWHGATPGAEVALEVSPGALAGITGIEVFDGATRVASWTDSPYIGSFTLPADARGVHGLTAVATLTGGEQRTGLIVPVMVGNQGVPGGGGLDDPNRPDAGPSSGPDGGPGGAIDGEGSGCGCRADTTPNSGLALVVLLLTLLVAGRRRNDQACERTR